MRITMTALLLLFLAACSGGAPERRATAPEPIETTFIVVRHAEKSAEDPRDPSLDASGGRRASALAAQLAERPLSAIYASTTRRARQTAAPTAERQGLEIRQYDPARPVSELATVLHTRHAGGTVLVVGHSNTVPGIVAALCACQVAPLDEDDYGDLYEVRIGADGGAELRHLDY
ncbi:phosphoglycerate mutase family protein [Luteimonas sp. RD2P54]|uniref:Phosphoglycerate mutase family protein n=1 Tax=Luteimonas endophytica TaxID=3042023 RepID=A0ABT6JC28_9GAMM|nr:phosphoglycerate mutase family protein [Luteimonas endophytica]MDH5824120.1 phosphoglycerate mutase family protein [Luteimonas endophytica]